MTSDSDRQKLGALDQRIKAAEKVAEDKAETLLPVDRTIVKGSQIGFEFAAVVLGCTGIGWLIDKFLSISPWGLLVMLFIGFGAGLFNVWRMLNGYEQAVGFRKRG